MSSWLADATEAAGYKKPVGASALEAPTGLGFNG